MALPPIGPRLLPLKAAAAYLGLPVTKLRRLAQTGRIASVRAEDRRGRPVGRLYFLREDLEAWLGRRRRGGELLRPEIMMPEAIEASVPLPAVRRFA